MPLLERLPHGFRDGRRRCADSHRNDRVAGLDRDLPGLAATRHGRPRENPSSRGPSEAQGIRGPSAEPDGALPGKDRGHGQGQALPRASRPSCRRGTRVGSTPWRGSHGTRRAVLGRFLAGAGGALHVTPGRPRSERRPTPIWASPCRGATMDSKKPEGVSQATAVASRHEREFLTPSVVHESIPYRHLSV